LATTPAMSLLWLRPGAGGPRGGGESADRKPKKPASSKGGATAAAEGEAEEDAVDPAVRSWWGSAG
jgi:hypothetical protein